MNRWCRLCKTISLCPTDRFILEAWHKRLQQDPVQTRFKGWHGTRMCTKDFMRAIRGQLSDTLPVYG